MTDIVDRLREASHFALMDAARQTVIEAADEIERLRLQVQSWSNHAHWLSDK